MTNDRLALLGGALERARNLYSRNPDSLPILWVVQQLEYLMGVATGQTSDRSRLKDINLGLIAAREIEDRDMELADMLHRIDAEARRL
jgi:1,2-phenylacetyl-CoA epoxidase PaaB subunit